MEIKTLEFSQINPYVRFVGKVNTHKNSKGDLTAWRIIYDYELMYLAKGKVIVFEENRKYEINANEVHLMPPNVWHKRQVVSDELKYYTVHLDWKFDPQNIDFDARKVYLSPVLDKKTGAAAVISDLLERIDYTLPDVELLRKVKVEEEVSVERAFDKIINFFISRAITGKKSLTILLNAQVLNVLGKVISQNMGGVSDISQKIYDLKTYIDENYDIKLDLKNYIENLGYNYDYFCREFSKSEGMTPIKYLKKRIIYESKTLIISGVSICEIAEWMGFEDGYSFSKFFKIMVGKAPSVYKKEAGLSNVSFKRNKEKGQ